MKKILTEWRRFKEDSLLLEGLGDNCAGRRSVERLAQQMGNFYTHINELTWVAEPVDETTERAVIKRVARKTIMHLHPDRNPGNKEAEEKFKTLSPMFDVLLNDECRGYFHGWLKLNKGVGKQDTSGQYAEQQSQAARERASTEFIGKVYYEFGEETAFQPEGMCFKSTCPMSTYEWVVFPDAYKDIFLGILKNMEAEGERVTEIISKFQRQKGRLGQSDIRALLVILRKWKQGGKF